VPRNRGKNTPLIAGLSLAGIQAPLILEGAGDTDVFERSVEAILAPARSPGKARGAGQLEGSYQHASAPGHGSAWVPAAVSACLLARSHPDGSGVLEIESLLAAGGRTHPRGAD
jgi:hypothetical protein